VVDVTTPPARTAPPVALVVNGRYQFGTYDGPIPTINPLDAATTWPAVSRPIRNLGLKEWEAFQLGDDVWFVLGAVYDAKALGLLQVIAVHKESGALTRYETKVRSSHLSVARGLQGTRSHGAHRGFSISITNHLVDGTVAIDAVHPGRDALAPLALHGTGQCGPDVAGHLVICHPFTDTRALYSHKTMMPFAGTLAIGDTAVTLDADRSFLILDDHHGDYPRPMRYDWVTAARRRADGRVEGFNLTANQVRDPHIYNENAVWIGSQVHRLPAVTFDRPGGPWGPWRVRDAAGAVDVTFTPTVRSTLHLGPKRSLAEYYAPYGWFEGTIETAAGAVTVDGQFGVGEQKRIRI
jgi:hypothetical protein